MSPENLFHQGHLCHVHRRTEIMIGMIQRASNSHIEMTRKGHHGFSLLFRSLFSLHHTSLCVVHCGWISSLGYNKVLMRLEGLPWWLGGKECTCKCRRWGFNLWVGKIPWRRKWQPIPMFLPGKSHEQKSLEGYTPHGVEKSHTLLSD